MSHPAFIDYLRAFNQHSNSESGLLLFLKNLKSTFLTRACNTSPSTLEGILVWLEVLRSRLTFHLSFLVISLVAFCKMLRV